MGSLSSNLELSTLTYRTGSLGLSHNSALTPISPHSWLNNAKFPPNCWYVLLYFVLLQNIGRCCLCYLFPHYLSVPLHGSPYFCCIRLVHFILISHWEWKFEWSPYWELIIHPPVNFNQALAYIWKNILSQGSSCLFMAHRAWNYFSMAYLHFI